MHASKKIGSKCLGIAVALLTVIGPLAPTIAEARNVGKVRPVVDPQYWGPGLEFREALGAWRDARGIVPDSTQPVVYGSITAAPGSPSLNGSSTGVDVPTFLETEEGITAGQGHVTFGRVSANFVSVFDETMVSGVISLSAGKLIVNGVIAVDSQSEPFSAELLPDGGVMVNEGENFLSLEGLAAPLAAKVIVPFINPLAAIEPVTALAIVIVAVVIVAAVCIVGAIFGWFSCDITWMRMWTPSWVPVRRLLSAFPEARLT